MTWSPRLSEYNYEFHYKKGINNSVADCMSRKSIKRETSDVSDKEIWCYTFSEEDEDSAQRLASGRIRKPYFDEVLATSP